MGPTNSATMARNQVTKKNDSTTIGTRQKGARHRSTKPKRATSNTPPPVFPAPPSCATTSVCSTSLPRHNFEKHRRKHTPHRRARHEITYSTTNDAHRRRKRRLSSKSSFEFEDFEMASGTTTRTTTRRRQSASYATSSVNGLASDARPKLNNQHYTNQTGCVFDFCSDGGFYNTEQARATEKIFRGRNSIDNAPAYGPVYSVPVAVTERCRRMQSISPTPTASVQSYNPASSPVRYMPPMQPTPNIAPLNAVAAAAEVITIQPAPASKAERNEMSTSVRYAVPQRPSRLPSVQSIPAVPPLYSPQSPPNQVWRPATPLYPTVRDTPAIEPHSIHNPYIAAAKEIVEKALEVFKEQIVVKTRNQAGATERMSTTGSTSSDSTSSKQPRPSHRSTSVAQRVMPTATAAADDGGPIKSIPRGSVKHNSVEQDSAKQDSAQQSSGQERSVQQRKLDQESNVLDASIDDLMNSSAVNSALRSFLQARNARTQSVVEPSCRLPQWVSSSRQVNTNNEHGIAILPRSAEMSRIIYPQESTSAVAASNFQKRFVSLTPTHTNYLFSSDSGGFRYSGATVPSSTSQYYGAGVGIQRRMTSVGMPSLGTSLSSRRTFLPAGGGHVVSQTPVVRSVTGLTRQFDRPILGIPTNHLQFSSPPQNVFTGPFVPSISESVTTSVGVPIAASSGAALIAASSGAAPIAASSGTAPIAAPSGAAPIAASSGAAPIAASSGAAPIAASSGAAPIPAPAPSAAASVALSAAGSSIQQGGSIILKGQLGQQPQQDSLQNSEPPAAAQKQDGQKPSSDTSPLMALCSERQVSSGDASKASSDFSFSRSGENCNQEREHTTNKKVLVAKLARPRNAASPVKPPMIKHKSSLHHDVTTTSKKSLENTSAGSGGQIEKDCYRAHHRGGHRDVDEGQSDRSPLLADSPSERNNLNRQQQNRGRRNGRSWRLERPTMTDLVQKAQQLRQSQLPQRAPAAQSGNTEQRTSGSLMERHALDRMCAGTATELVPGSSWQCTTATRPPPVPRQVKQIARRAAQSKSFQQAQFHALPESTLVRKKSEPGSRIEQAYIDKLLRERKKYINEFQQLKAEVQTLRRTSRQLLSTDGQSPALTSSAAPQVQKSKPNQHVDVSSDIEFNSPEVSDSGIQQRELRHPEMLSAYLSASSMEREGTERLKPLKMTPSAHKALKQVLSAGKQQDMPSGNSRPQAFPLQSSPVASRAQHLISASSTDPAFVFTPQKKAEAIMESCHSESNKRNLDWPSTQCIKNETSVDYDGCTTTSSTPREAALPPATPLNEDTESSSTDVISADKTMGTFGATFFMGTHMTLTVAAGGVTEMPRF